MTTIEPQGTSGLKSTNHHFGIFSSPKPAAMQAFPGRLVFKHLHCLQHSLPSSLKALMGEC